MAQVTVVTNNKGGVGKTTTAANLAAALRLRGYDVLCIDLDGQANLTDVLGASGAQGGSYDAMQGQKFITPVRVRPQAEGAGVLDVLPATAELWALDVALAKKADRLTRFGEVVDKYRNNYDIIIIDTTPTMGNLSISALYAADNAVITTTPDIFSTRGLVSIKGAVDNINGKRAVPLGVRVLFCMYDGRLGLHRLMADKVREAFKVFNTVIRKNVALAESPLENTDVLTYAPRSNGAQDYTALAEEFARVNKLKHHKHQY